MKILSIIYSSEIVQLPNLCSFVLWNSDVRQTDSTRLTVHFHWGAKSAC